MSRPDQPRVLVNRERELQALMDFATELSTNLCDTRASRSNDLVVADIRHHSNIATAHAQDTAQPTSRAMARSIESHGRDLWNLCLRLKRESAQTAPKLLIWARVFSFALLCLGRGSRWQKQDAESEVVYLMTQALTLARLCVAAGELDPATGALRKAAEFLDRLKKMSLGQSAKKGRLGLEANYHAMRIALSWKQDRLDVAEHMFSNTETLRPFFNVSSAEVLADTLRHIGADLFSKGDYKLAIKWSRRAYDVLNSQDLGLISAQGLENRIAICHNLVQSLLRISTPESLNEADNLVAYVEAQIGDKPVVLHWRLEILQSSPDEVFDADKYSSILRRMIRTFDSCEQSFLFLLHHIKELRNKNPILAVALMDEFLTSRVLKTDNHKWLNKALVTRVWMSTMETDSPNTHKSREALNELLDTVSDEISEPLSPDAAGAAHSEFIWKRLEADFAYQQHAEADGWCMIALHELFSNSGPDNLAKFGRKQLLCALGLNDSEKARAVFARLPDAAQKDPLTRFLMFKVSLLDWDHQLGCQSIEFLGRATDDGKDNQELLYACVREAQEVGDEVCTLSALKATVENWKPGKASAGSIPSMIRCSIRLIVTIENRQRASKGDGSTESSIEDLCTMFERAAGFAKQKPLDQDGKIIFTLLELTWFRKNAYNIGAKNIGIWNLPNMIRIFTACLDYITCFPSDILISDTKELTLMKMRCHFIVAAAQVALARTTSQTEEQLQRYQETRQHAIVLYKHSVTEVSQDEHVIQDLHAKLATMAVFEFEAAVVLNRWDDLGRIVRGASLPGDEAILKAMGDCLLRSQTPGQVMYSTMRIIIDKIFALEMFDSEMMCKYIRCIYQVALPLEDDMAFQVLEDALKLARDSAKVEKSLPTAELEWLVTTSFNHAIDFYARSEEEKCLRWAHKARDLATFMKDGGKYKKLLQDRLGKLRFGAAPR